MLSNARLVVGETRLGLRVEYPCETDCFLFYMNWIHILLYICVRRIHFVNAILYVPDMSLCRDA